MARVAEPGNGGNAATQPFSPVPEPERGDVRVSRAVATVAGAIAAAGAAAILAAWHLHFRHPVQLRPDWTPVAYNTGVATFLLGLTIVLSVERRTRVAVGLASGALLLGGLNVLEFAFGRGLGIDTVLFTPDGMAGALPPGRMAPNTAVAVLLLAAALLALLFRRDRPVIAAVVAALVLALGVTSLAGYWADLPAAYGRAEDMSVAPQTAVLLVLLGIGLGALAMLAGYERGQPPRWTALLATLAGFTGTLILWQALGETPRTAAVADGTLAVGITLSVALGAALHFGHTARSSALEARRALAELLLESTRRTAAQAALARSEARLDLIVQTVAEGVLITDLDGQITFANTAAEQILCLTHSQIAQRRYDDPGWRTETLDGQPMSADQLPVGRVLGGEETVLDCRHAIERPSGQRVMLSVNATRLRSSTGDPIGAVASFRDITEQVRAEAIIASMNRQLERRVVVQTAELASTNRRLESVNAELETFAHSVSHDLRAPLRALDGFSQVLLEDYGGALDKRAGDLLQRIRAASQRMGHLIDDLLMLSRLDRAEMRRVPLNLASIAADAIERLRSADRGRHVRVTAPERLSANGDPRLVAIAMENLLSNAWKFTRPRALGEIELGVEQRNGERVWFVRDNGVGFDMAYADKLFGAFQRLHGAGEFEGTGIGLATVARVIHRHGGRIWAEAAVDRGACFYFTLPVDGGTTPAEMARQG